MEIPSFWFTFAGGHWKFHMSSIGGGGLIMRSAILYRDLLRDLIIYNPLDFQRP